MDTSQMNKSHALYCLTIRCMYGISALSDVPVDAARRETNTHHGFRTEATDANVPSAFGNIPRDVARERDAIAPSRDR